MSLPASAYRMTPKRPKGIDRRAIRREREEAAIAVMVKELAKGKDRKETMRQARYAGATWRAIGEALGCSRQAAQQFAGWW
jgi:hypothetical protein